LKKGEQDKQSKISNQAYSHKPKETKTEIKREFYVSDELGNFFSGFKHGVCFWSDQISLARELTEEVHFKSLIRWEKQKTLKKEYL
jgi:hypothetical protein